MKRLTGRSFCANPFAICCMTLDTVSVAEGEDNGHEKFVYSIVDSIVYRIFLIIIVICMLPYFLINATYTRTLGTQSYVCSSIFPQQTG